MSPERQRIAIAKAAGWANFGVFNGRQDQPAGFHPASPYATSLPDYLNDLNAARDALIELIVGDDLKEFLYRTSLETVCGHDWSLTFFASADQVCEAILRAIGKWEGQQ